MRRTVAIVACVASTLLVVGLLGGCGSEGTDEAAGARGATYHDYCAALHRMNGEVGSLGAARATLDDKVAAGRTIAALRDVRDHAPGTLPSLWQEVIDGYQEQAIVVQTDRTALVKAAAAKAAKAVPQGATRTEAWTAIGKASYKALRADEKADAPHQQRASRLLRTALPDAVGSAQGICGLSWQAG